MPLTLGQDVLLFFEDRDRDTFFRGDRRLRRTLRRATSFLRPGRQKISGFELSFILLCRALEQSGLRVHINDFHLARRNPHFPIGICGYPHILDHWTLPNPAVLGPGLFDHPKLAPHAMDDPRFHSYIAFCEWMRDLFAGIYPRQLIDLWFGGIDLGDWPDTSTMQKDIDVLVYDKIRWNRDTLVPLLLDPILNQLRALGRTHEVIRYGKYTHESYRQLLERSRSMIFLCEHETQGMAYQEALASNVPILAWDQGYWLDPNRPQWEPNPVPASSVPYFSNDCGEKFTAADTFSEVFERFYAQLEQYRPRKYVGEHLSLSESARSYLRAYYRVASQGNAQ